MSELSIERAGKPLLLNIVLKVLSRAIRQEKKKRERKEKRKKLIPVPRPEETSYLPKKEKEQQETIEHIDGLQNEIDI